MKTLHIAAALGVALAAPVAALAADAQLPMSSGHYEWRDAPQFGPRATGPARKRVWVLDDAQMANCACDMMKMSAADCMKDMRRTGASPSAG